MAGQGYKRARDCIKRHGWAFRDRPKRSAGLLWCRLCDYRVDIHETIVKSEQPRQPIP